METPDAEYLIRNLQIRETENARIPDGLAIERTLWATNVLFWNKPARKWAWAGRFFHGTILPWPGFYLVGIAFVSIGIRLVCWV